MVDVSDQNRTHWRNGNSEAGSSLLGDQNCTMLREVEIQKSEIRALCHQNGLKWPQDQELEIQKSEFQKSESRARWILQRPKIYR